MTRFSRTLASPLWLAFCATCACDAALASDGDLDLAFGAQARYAGTFAGNMTYNQAHGMVIRTDGKIVLAGAASTPTNTCSTFSAVRLLADAAGVDTSFGQGGSAQTCLAPLILSDATHEVDVVTTLRMANDESIFIAGFVSYILPADLSKIISVPAISKRTANGALDTSFGSGGVVAFGNLQKGGGVVADVTIRDDGMLFVVGANNFDKWTLWAVDGNGSAVAEFDDTATQGAAANAVASQTDGKIVVAGEYYNETSANFDCVVSRFIFQAGLLTRDLSFGTQGSTGIAFDISGNKTDTCTALAIQSDGSILFGGSAQVAGGGTLATFGRLTSAGNLDVSFAKQTTFFASNASNAVNVVSSLLVQSDGKILVLGYGTEQDFGTDDADGKLDFGVIRTLKNGALDSPFGNVALNPATVMIGFEAIVGGPTDDTAYSGALFDDRIVIAGVTKGTSKQLYAVTRLLDDSIFANGFQ